MFLPKGLVVAVLSMHGSRLGRKKMQNVERNAERKKGCCTVPEFGGNLDGSRHVSYITVFT